MGKSLYLVEAGPRADGVGLDRPRVVVCASARVAALVAGDSGALATVWRYFAADLDGSGWLLVRWRGLDVDYGRSIRHFALPDGTEAGFRHNGADRVSLHDGNPWDLLSGSVWWSTAPLPPGLDGHGVRTTPADFAEPMTLRRRIEADEATASDPDSGYRGVGRNSFRVEVTDKPGKGLRSGEQWLPGIVKAKAAGGEPSKKPRRKKAAVPAEAPASAPASASASATDEAPPVP